jgi:hypothetical protein
MKEYQECRSVVGFNPQKNMKLTKNILLAAALTSLSVGTANAAIIMVAEYHLGEAGSLGASNSSLIDSATGGTPSGAQNMDGTAGNPSGTSVGTVGVFAPGSTAYLDTSATNAGWYTNSGNMATLPTDNFAFGIYARTATLQSKDIFILGGGTGAFKLSMDSNGWGASSSNVSWIGNSNGTSGSFTANTWVHLALVRNNGSTAFYIDGVQQGSTYGGVPVHDTAHISVASGGVSYFNGNLDEARVVTFDVADAGAGNINVLNALQAIPEPSSVLLGGLGMLALLRRRR